jgi:hypothetical protein
MHLWTRHLRQRKTGTALDELHIGFHGCRLPHRHLSVCIAVSMCTHACNILHPHTHNTPPCIYTSMLLYTVHIHSVPALIFCVFFCTYAASLTKSGSSVGFSSLATTPSTQEQILKSPPLLTLYSKLTRALNIEISWQTLFPLAAQVLAVHLFTYFAVSGTSFRLRVRERRWGVRGGVQEGRKGVGERDSTPSFLGEIDASRIWRCIWTAWQQSSNSSAASVRLYKVRVSVNVAVYALRV